MQPSTKAEIIFERLSAALLTDYQRYKQDYERAVTLVRGRPVEPADELRNAFDHFSLAVAIASTPRDRGVSSPQGNDSDLEDALIHILQGQRHIALARYYCLQHQIVALSEKVRQAVASPLIRDELDLPRTRAKEIDQKVSSLAPIEQLAARHRGTDVMADIVDIEKRIDELSSIVLECAQLFELVSDKSRRTPRL